CVCVCEPLIALPKCLYIRAPLVNDGVLRFARFCGEGESENRGLEGESDTEEDGEEGERERDGLEIISVGGDTTSAHETDISHSGVSITSRFVPFSDFRRDRERERRLKRTRERMPHTPRLRLYPNGQLTILTPYASLLSVVHMRTTFLSTGTEGTQEVERERGRGGESLGQSFLHTLVSVGDTVVSGGGRERERDSMRYLSHNSLPLSCAVRKGDQGVGGEGDVYARLYSGDGENVYCRWLVPVR
ncbi:hypothetical protein KIPB_014906, partial [Kipferlia bialata]